MKIDGQSPGELLQRMQEAHEHEQASSTGRAASFDATPVSPASGPETEAPRGIEGASPPERPTLEARVEGVAGRALSGDFESSEAVRGAVIEEIIDEKFGETVPRSQVRQMRETLTAALVDDPDFRRQVDDMLLLAARELARS